ncbi:YopX family protein [Staphylococcus hominis]|uniref:YopX family protein n=1 Tax=Staphylococcus hominis TaxID=1290 RepID=UPI00119C9FA9|nr:YopX family protein [Staphylococcus hominis]
MINKFRAWDEKGREMCDVISLDWKHEIIEISNGYAIWPRDFFEVEIMQSTGLKDILGNDIYEGDIVKVLVEDDSPKIMSGKMYIGVVAYNQGVFDIRTFKDTYLGIIPQVYLSDVNCAFRVLGNIYENEELLEDN